ncbi:MAG: hypothetical protein Q7S02_00575 [bacterium]|nr:hypothetical protein [bacterium]
MPTTHRGALRMAIAVALIVVGSAPTHASAAVLPGTLVRGSQAAVYFVAQDGQRYAFPNEKIYRTWFSDFHTVQRIDDTALSAVPLGGVVRYRPGVRLVKITTDPKVYAVGSYGKLRWVSAEWIAERLHGLTWATQIDDLPDAFFAHYTIGDPITSEGDFSPSASRDLAPTIDAYLGRIADRGATGSAPPTTQPQPATSTERSTTTVAAPTTSVARSTCAAPLPPPEGPTITVSDLAQLITAITTANTRKDASARLTILLEDGTYEITNPNDTFRLQPKLPNLTIRSKSGNRDAVILKGRGMTGNGPSSVFIVQTSDITIADLSVGLVRNHPIQIMGERDTDRIHIRNVRFFDGGEQLLKVSYNANRGVMPEDGIVECSLFEYTAGIGPNWYIGGIDAHHAARWIVRDNVFRGIRSPQFAANTFGALAEHAIHFWSNSEDTLVERNTIINSDRGIGFGLGGPKSDRGHWRGIIRNNVIAHDVTNGDVGIGLESARDVQVYHNSIFFAHAYKNAIEYRFPTTTNAHIANNVTNKRNQERDGAAARLEGNVTNAQRNWFVDVMSGDLHLTRMVSDVVDRGVALVSISTDIDSDARGNAPDIGADEWRGRE